MQSGSQVALTYLGMVCGSEAVEVSYKISRAKS